MRKLVEDADLVPRGLGVSKASRALLAEAEADASRVVVCSRGVDDSTGQAGTKGISSTRVQGWATSAKQKPKRMFNPLERGIYL